MSPLSLRKARRTLLLCCLLSAASSVSASGFSINRLQLRLNDNDSYSLTQSSFRQFSNRAFLLQTLNSDRDPADNSHLTRFELLVGRPAGNGELGWVTRAQKWHGEKGVYSAGLQLNLDKWHGLDQLLARHKLRTFVQAFVRSEEQHLGQYDLLHYYDLKLPRLSLNLRGNNILYFGGTQRTDQLWVDAIYPLADYLDFYYRWNYLSRSNELLGVQGSTSSIGIRFNF